MIAVITVLFSAGGRFAVGFCVLSKFTLLAAPGVGSLCAVGGSREAAIVILSLLLCSSSLVLYTIIERRTMSGAM